MFSFASIFIKNFQNMLRSKFVIGLVILGPLALVALFSFGVVGTGLTNIDASFYSSETGDYRDLFLDGLYASSFIILETEAKQDCIQKVLNGFTNVCIILKEDPDGIPLPKNIGDKNIKNFKKSLGVEIQVDFSKQRVVWGIINRVQRVVDGFSEIIQQQVIDEVSTKFDNSLNQIETLEQNIRYIEFQIVENKDKLSTIKSNLEQFKIQSSANLQIISTNVNQISGYVPVGAGGQSIVQINSALSNLNSLILSTEADSNSISLVEGSINQVSSNLELVKFRVLDTKNELINLRELLSDKGSFNLNKFIDPIPLSYSSVSEESVSNNTNDLNLVDYLLPSLISFFVVFTSLMFSSSLIIKERSSNAHIRNYLGKSSGVSFVLGNISFLILTVLFQVIVLLIFANFSINPSISHFWFPLIIYLGLGVSIFSALGMIIGYTFNSRDTVILSAVCISLIFIIFSPLVNPLETMPEALKTIFSKSPSIMVEQEVSKILFFNKGIVGNYTPIIILSIMFLFLLSISIVLHKISKERLVKE